MHWRRRPLGRALLLACTLLAVPAAAQGKKAPEAAYVPAPSEQISGYSEKVMPCEILEDVGPSPIVTCEGDLLQGKSLRELAILRNTIFARYGWSGFRKAWLLEHFKKQPWFKPNPKFSYKLLSDADRKNVHFIAVREQSFTERELRHMQDTLLARAGKVFGDVYEWELKDGRKVRSCEQPKEPLTEDGCTGFDCEGVASRDCEFREEKWYRPDPKFTEDKLPAEARIELGLISRALGSFASDTGKLEKGSQASLDRILSVQELRQLSLRDLRLLRNTIYARRGRPFKSKVLQAHFKAMSWYHEDASYTDARLTENDKRNVALIRSVEDEFGGPLKDEDWLIDPATDAA